MHAAAYLVTGVHPITAIYTNTDGNFSDSTSPVLEQIVQSNRKTSTILTSWPDPSCRGLPRSPYREAFPILLRSHQVHHQLDHRCHSLKAHRYLTHSLLGTEILGPTGKAILTTSSLPIGSDDLYAVYNGDAIFASSTSPVIVQVVLSKAGHCSDDYNNWYLWFSRLSRYPRHLREQLSSGSRAAISKSSAAKARTASGAATATTLQRGNGHNEIYRREWQ